MNKTMPIVEIFSSIQGEGYSTCFPAVFVRFSGCNLKCEWCDTEASLRKKALAYTEEDLLESVVKASKNITSNRPVLVFTGGEPSLYRPQILSFINRYRKEILNTFGSIDIETNGVESIGDWFPFGNWYEDFMRVNVSPKFEYHEYDHSLRFRSILSGNFFFKLVVGSLQEAQDSVATLYRIAGKNVRITHIYLQPKITQELKLNSDAYFSLIKELIPMGLKLSLQVHKLVRVE